MNEEIPNISQDEIVRLHLRIQTAALVLICVLLLTIFIFLVTRPVTVPLDTTVETVETIPDVTTESIPETTVESIIPDNLEPIPDVTEPTETSVEVTEAPIDIPAETETTSTVDPESLELLACVIYQEAGADNCCDDCRRRIADVVLNRVESPLFPNTIREVLTARDQYGSYHWTGVVWPARASYDVEKHAVERAYRIAEEVLNGQHSSLYGNGYIWQAGFKQGTEGFWCCGTYFGR